MVPLKHDSSVIQSRVRRIVDPAKHCLASLLDRNGKYLKDAREAAVEGMTIFEKLEGAVEGNYE